MTDRSLGTHTAHWFGIVVNPIDPEQSGRVQVRIRGRHDDTTNIPDHCLPWAIRSHDSHGRVGNVKHLRKGAQVFGIWYDKDYQIPIMIGTIGKAGNLIGNMSTDGKPAIDLKYGAVPAYAQGSVYSNYTRLNPNRPSLLAINAGLADVSNVVLNAGVIFTESVQKLLKIPLYPTNASIGKDVSQDVLKITQMADPSFQNSVLKCFVPNLLKINSMNIMSAIGQMLAGALVGALLALANKLGLFKLLGMLNQALAAAANVLGQAQQIMSMLNSIAAAACLPNPINQNLLSAPLQAVATAMYALNSAVGWVAGMANNPISAATYSAVNGLLSDNNSVQPKPASVQTSSSAVPAPIVDEPPDNYVQVYYQEQDPYPGFIEWEDPDNVQPKVYTRRKEEPMYGSPEEHTHHVMQNHLSTGIEQMVSSNSLTIQGLMAYMESASSLGQTFAATRVMGAAAGRLSPIAILAFSVPTLAKLINNVFAPPKIKSKMKSDTTDKPVENAAKGQSELEQRMKKLRVASQQSSSDQASSVLPTPPVPPDAGSSTVEQTEVPTATPTVNDMLQTPEAPPPVTSAEINAKQATMPEYDAMGNPTGGQVSISPYPQTPSTPSNALTLTPTDQNRQNFTTIDFSSGSNF